MRFRLFKLGIEGKVAMVNLCLVGLVLIVIKIFVPSVIDVDLTSKGMLNFYYGLEVVLAVLSFPVGWLAMLGGSLDGPPIMSYAVAAIVLPLNAYLWGSVVATIVRWRKGRSTAANSAGSVSLPTSGTQIEARTDDKE